ncbi:MAG: acylphosphatase [Bacteroidetes bacterium]|nr:acylphosphatase [Bacteroidota bacterium]
MSDHVQHVEPVERARLTVRVSGTVQGVGFRYFVRRVVSRLSVTGWVRNDADGTVALVAEGSVEELNELLEAVSQGPSAGEVEDVEVTWSSTFGTFEGFKVKLW